MYQNFCLNNHDEGGLVNTGDAGCEAWGGGGEPEGGEGGEGDDGHASSTGGGSGTGGVGGCEQEGGGDHEGYGAGGGGEGGAGRGGEDGCGASDDPFRAKTVVDRMLAKQKQAIKVLKAACEVEVNDKIRKHLTSIATAMVHVWSPPQERGDRRSQDPEAVHPVHAAN